jgi:hypothetical protein
MNMTMTTIMRMKAIITITATAMFTEICQIYGRSLQGWTFLRRYARM